MVRAHVADRPNPFLNLFYILSAITAVAVVTAIQLDLFKDGASTNTDNNVGDKCFKCGGSGACESCSGTGINQYASNGSNCRSCMGTGICSFCGGTGGI